MDGWMGACMNYESSGLEVLFRIISSSNYREVDI